MAQHYPSIQRASTETDHVDLWQAKVMAISLAYKYGGSFLLTWEGLPNCYIAPRHDEGYDPIIVVVEPAICWKVG